jgi:mono/diheme cytochrome c family protein
MTGARPIDTPFGVVFSSNLTPDPRTGIGAWTANDFWTALHRGRSRDGRRLAPAFPYEHTTLIRRDDSDAIFAWLKTLAPVDSPQPAHQLTWPLGTQPVLALWQAFFFKPASFVPDPARDDRWNRGAYLVEAVGHCAACHGPRNMFGATRSVKNLSGSALPGSAWVAPSLLDDRETGLASTPLDQIVQLLKTGRSVQAGTSGPMADVVQHGLQYLGDDDLLAIASYLKDRAYATSPRAKQPAQPPAQLGARIYQRECADCHGESGAGQPPHYPALRGNRAVLHQNPANTVLAVLHGGYPPVTRGNPAPAGMPPFTLPLSTAEVAAVVSWIRGGLQEPGPGASPVSPSGVEQIRNRSR